MNAASTRRQRLTLYLEQASNEASGHTGGGACSRAYGGALKNIVASDRSRGCAAGSSPRRSDGGVAPGIAAATGGEQQARGRDHQEWCLPEPHEFAP
jgi:hypothetical protein